MFEINYTKFKIYELNFCRHLTCKTELFIKNNKIYEYVVSDVIVHLMRRSKIRMNSVINKNFLKTNKITEIKRLSTTTKT